MRFKQIVTIGDVIELNMIESSLNELNKYSENPVKIISSNYENETEIIKNISDADCILLSYRTSITKNILLKCNNLKLICICGTNSNLIDIEQCSKQNITILNVKDYGDEGVVEWIFFQLISLIRGFGKYKWKSLPAELNKKTIGIIGFGAIGKLLAKGALGLNMNILYYSKSRNQEWEKKGVKYVDKKELLLKSDIITLQTPKNLKILDKNDFNLMNEKILINNTLGKAFQKEDFIEWIKKPNNFMITDIVSDFKNEFEELERVIYSNYISGKTKEAEIRLSEKVLNNIKSYLN